MKDFNNFLSEYKTVLENVIENSTKTKEILWSTLTPKTTSTLFDSKILSLNSGHSEVLSKMINNPRIVHKVERLYRAS